MSRSTSLSSQPAFSTLSDVAYERLRTAILRGVIPDEARLADVVIAPVLGMSRTPVREALQRLINEGLLRYTPHRNIVLSLYDDEALQEHYFVLSELESLIAGEAATKATRVELAQMQDVLEREAQALADGDLVACVETNVQLHALLCEAAHNRFLVKTMRVMQDASQMLRRTTLHNPERTAVAHREHQTLVAALQARDVEAARAAARAHQATNLTERLRHRDAERRRRAVAPAQASGDWLEKLKEV